MDDLRIGNFVPQVRETDVGQISQGNGMSESRVFDEMKKNDLAVPDLQGATGSKNFVDLLRDSIDEVNQQQVNADQSIKNLLAGRSKNIHETMLAVERADIALKTMMQVRNKVLDAYREIMRMQV